MMGARTGSGVDIPPVDCRDMLSDIETRSRGHRTTSHRIYWKRH